jgi:uncharacterized repeat protein (TIGR01451 family)
VDADTSNNTSSVSTVVASAQTDLALVETGPSSVAPGGEITYVIRVTNLGPVAALDVRTSDAITGGTTFLASSTAGPPTTCTPPAVGGAGLLTCVTPLLAVGGVIEFTVTVQASPDLEVGALIRNGALVTARTPDLNPNNDRDEVVTRVAAATEADLMVEKSDASDPVLAGANVTYTVVVTNQGPAAATNVVLTDTLPAGLALVSATSPTATCTGTSCTLDTLAAGATATVTIVAATSATGLFTNTATVSATEVDPVPANNTASQPTTVATADQADVAIAKVGPTVVEPGQAIVYQIAVLNRGPATALDVVIEDVLPAGLTFVANTGACTTAYPCTIASLAPGASATIATSVSVDAGVVVPSTLTNTASVTASTSDPDDSNNSASVQTTVLTAGTADLAIAKSDSPDPVVAGTTYSYVLTLGNRGPSAATDVTVSDTLPAGVTVVSVESTLGTCDVSTLTCDLGTLNPAGAAQIQIVATAPAALPSPNPMINTATVTSVATPDPDQSNNTASEPTTVVARTDVQVTKTGPASVIPGSVAAYTVTVTNAGPSVAQEVTLADPPPAGLELAGVAGACSALPCALGSLVPNDPRVVTVTLRVPPDYAGAPSFNNTATVSTSTADVDPSNNSATVTTSIDDPVADVMIGKTGPLVVNTNEVITYTLTIRNAGPSTATDVVVDDTAPPALTFIAASAPCAGGFPCTLTAIAPDETISITATFQSPASLEGVEQIINTATVTAATTDPQPDNNTARATTFVGARADVGVTKSVTPDQARIGENATFTVQATNNGPNPASGVVITDLLPTGLTFQSATASLGSYDATSGRWAIGDLAVGQSGTLTVVARVEVAGAIINTAIRTEQDQPDRDESNDSAVAALNAGPYADIGIDNAPSTNRPAEGEAVTFTVTVRNNGPSTAPAVTVVDVLPAALTFVSATASQGTYDAATGLWTIGTMARGDVTTLRIETIVARPGPILSRARVTGLGTLDQRRAALRSVERADALFDPNPANDRDAAVLNATTEINVAVTKVALRPTVGVFEIEPFLVVVTNDGPSAATGVVVTDVLPNGLQFVEARASRGSYDATTGLWTVGSLDPEEYAVLGIAARAAAAGTVTNTATLTAVNQPDLEADDNSDNATVTTPLPTGGTCTDLELRHTFPAMASPGAALTYRYTAINRGPAYAQDVVIDGMIPPGITVESMTASPGGSCVVENDMVVCRWPGQTLIGEGAARTADVVWRTNASMPANTPVWGWFMVMSSTPDCMHSNDMVDSYVFVEDGLGRADLQITSAIQTAAGSAAQMSVPVGTSVAVRLAVTNHGPLAASGDYVLLASDFSAFVIEGGTTSAGAIAGAEWQTGPIDPGATVFAEFRLRMTNATAVRAQAIRIRGIPADPDATNDWTEVIIDGVAPAPGGGRYVAVGNLDGAGGGEIVTGGALGDRPQVRAFTGSGDDLGVRFYAFEPTFLGGVRIASCDVNGDGSDEIIAGQGPGGSAIRVLRVVGGTVTEITGFHPFEPEFAGGVHLSCADVDANGRAEVVVGAGPGRAADVRVFSVGSAGAELVASWTAYSDFAGGVRVAAARYAGGALVGPFEVVTTPGPGIPIDVRAWAVAGGSASLVGAAQLYGPLEAGGASTALGDLDGDGALDLAITPDTGSPGVLHVLSLASGATIFAAPSGAGGYARGVHVAIGALDGGSGRPEIVATGGPGSLPVVMIVQVGPAALRGVFLAAEIP